MLIVCCIQDSVFLFGTIAAELHSSVRLFGTMAAELHNSVRLFGTMAAELHNSVSLFGTMHIATEVQQRGDLRGSGLTTQSAIQYIRSRTHFPET